VLLAIAAGVRSHLFCLLLVVGSCTDDPSPIDDVGGEGDMDLGDRLPDDLKADGNWGAALTCKPVPNLPRLANPKLTVSLDGLTLHLVDVGGTYDKVFPIGPGKVDTTETDLEYRESLSYRPVLSRGTGDFKITPSSIQPCKTWWTDPETGEKSPVFAGLPFMSWSGNYAIHGPIDNYRAENGGTLRRGYVSHGCIRMEAADVLEVYARIKGIASVPVHVQRERERRVDGTIVDVASKWIGAACSSDSECAYANGYCAMNPLSQRGFCSARCTGLCADRKGYPSTFCVADPAAPSQGMCVAKAQAENFECRPYDHFGIVRATRLNNPAIAANVCMPKSPGWIGDHCKVSSDCQMGTECRGATASAPGICSQACTSLCPDQPGFADTTCAAVASLGAGGSCVRQCTPSSNGSECPRDMTCGTVMRFGTTTPRNVCLPAR
jgi:hypothetical protein